jgi:predicted transposase YbfD/YdcC
VQSRQVGQEDWEERYYLSSRPLDSRRPQLWADRVRAHWSVENRNHWRKDATLMEDKTRSRQTNIVSNLILLRQAVLLLFHETGRHHRWMPGWIEENQRNPKAVFRMICS